MDAARTLDREEARKHAGGTGGDHHRPVTRREGGWSCGCDYFRAHAFCAHTLAAERLLGELVTPT